MTWCRSCCRYPRHFENWRLTLETRWYCRADDGLHGGIVIEVDIWGSVDRVVGHISIAGRTISVKRKPITASVNLALEFGWSIRTHILLLAIWSWTVSIPFPSLLHTLFLFSSSTTFHARSSHLVISQSCLQRDITLPAQRLILLISCYILTNTLGDTLFLDVETSPFIFESTTLLAHTIFDVTFSLFTKDCCWTKVDL